MGNAGESDYNTVVLSGTDVVVPLEMDLDDDPLRLGRLAPLRDTPDDGVLGAQARLFNLGYNVGAVDGKLSRGTHVAIAMFQHDREMPVDGELSPELIEQLMSEHGC